MADIAHTVPAIITARDGSTFGFERPGLQITQFDSGPMRSRDWLGYNLRTYDLDPSLWQSSTTALEEWSAFWHHIGGGSEVGYIVEPTSETHRDLICGGLGDGSQTTFPIPVMAPASVTVFVDGAPQESSAYTVHPVSNLLDDAAAIGADADEYTTSNGTDSAVTGVSFDGLSCIKVVPDGGAVPITYTSDFGTVTVGESYTAVSACLATAASAQNYRATISWYTAANAYLSIAAGSNVSVSAGAWMAISGTLTSPATAARARVGCQRNDATGTDSYYADCFAVCPGDYTRWHLPSQAPGLVEFAAAPAAGARITATATGKRVSRCRFEPGSSWRVSSAGHAASRSIRAVEVIEV